MAIGAEERDAIATSDTLSAQCTGQSGGAIRELSICESLVPADDRHIVAELLARIAEKANRRQRNIHVGLLQRLAIGTA